MNCLDRRRGAAASLLCLALGWGAPALAQPAGPAQHTETVPEEQPEENELSWAVSAGGQLNKGNTESWNVTAGSDFRIVRSRHQFSATFSFNYGQADVQGDDMDGYEDTVRNTNARLRYDFFLTDMDALFAALAHRWDTFAGLDTRLQGQAGYLRNFYEVEKHKFWGEAGYDLTWDNRDPDPLFIDDGMGGMMLVDNTEIVHSARLFLGYINEANEMVAFTSGIEALMNVEKPEDTRINFDAAVRSSFTDALKLELKLKVQFDNVPVPGKEKTDLTTTASLIYTLI